jgi:HAD superfamily hydrolase (TIGR01490 family)
LTTSVPSHPTKFGTTTPPASVPIPNFLCPPTNFTPTTSSSLDLETTHPPTSSRCQHFFAPLFHLSDATLSPSANAISRQLLLDECLHKGDFGAEMAASYFDVDGTLIRTNLVHPTLYYVLHQNTPLHSMAKLGTALLKAPWMAWAETRDRRIFNELLFTSYGGMSEDRLIGLADETFDRVIKPNIYPGARDLVQMSLDKGHDVVIVSGALEVLMQLLAKHLGATGVIANRLEIKDRLATGKLLRPVVAGPEKARIIREHARSHGHDLDDCFAYSDSYSDVPMLSVVGHPAAVNPDRKLQLLASAYHWPIINVA